jgi:hypothetical protein
LAFQFCEVGASLDIFFVEFTEYEERVRRRRERRRDVAIRRAAKAAAAEAARAAIRDREDLVAKLEKEKEALEHILAEKEEEQVKDVKVFNPAHRTTQFWTQ